VSELFSVLFSAVANAGHEFLHGNFVTAHPAPGWGEQQRIYYTIHR
jgi:hypothetical protein